MASETCRIDSITSNFEKINVNPLSDNLFIFQKDNSTTLQEFSDKYATCLPRDLIIMPHRMSIVKCYYANYLWQLTK